MTAANNDPDSNEAAGHPADAHVAVSAGEVLSDRELRPTGAAGPRVPPDDEPPTDLRDRTPNAGAASGRTAEPTGAEPGGEVSDDLSVEEVAEDAIDYFSDDPDDESPASDADAPAPG